MAISRLFNQRNHLPAACVIFDFLGIASATFVISSPSCRIDVAPNINQMSHEPVAFYFKLLCSITCRHVAVNSDRIITDSFSVRIDPVRSGFQRRIGRMSLVTRSINDILLSIADTIQ